jgi:triacylglycerol lipase
MSTLELIDAPPLPLFLSYAELDLLSMQIQAGELFGRLVCRHGFRPDIRVIPAHNHLTQVTAINTGDESLTAPLLEFLRSASER